MEHSIQIYDMGRQVNSLEMNLLGLSNRSVLTKFMLFFTFIVGDKSVEDFLTWGGKFNLHISWASSFRTHHVRAVGRTSGKTEARDGEGVLS